MSGGFMPFSDTLLLAREMNIVSLYGERLELTRDFLRTVEETISLAGKGIRESFNNLEDAFLGVIMVSIVAHCGELKKEELFALMDLVSRIILLQNPQLREKFIDRGLWVRRGERDIDS